MTLKRTRRARLRGVLVDGDAHEDAVLDRRQVEAGGGARLLGDVDRPLHALRRRADREVDLVGHERGLRDHAGAAGRDLEARLADLRVPPPAQLAPRGPSAEVQRLRRLDALVELGAEGHLLEAEVGLHLLAVRDEPADRDRREPDVGEGRVAAPDAERRASARLHLDRRDGPGRHGGVAGEGVRHAGLHEQPLGRLRRERQLDVGVARQVLRVRHPDAVPPVLLDRARLRRALPGESVDQCPELHAITPL
jgi:hypothetical protein